MTPLANKGQMHIVLSWPNAPSDIDLFSNFKTSENTVCSVFFGKKYCNGVYLHADNNLGGRKGAETITIQLFENFIYSFAVRKYKDGTENGRLKGEEKVKDAPKMDHKIPKKLEDKPLSDSKAKVSVYVSGYEFALFSTSIVDNIDRENLLNPSEDEKKIEEKINWWLAFCLNGSKGIDSVKIVNKLASKQPDYKYCQDLYVGNEEENVQENDEEKNKRNSVEKKKYASSSSAFIELEFDGDSTIRKVNHFLKKRNI